MKSVALSKTCLTLYLMCIAFGELDAILNIDVCINQTVCNCENASLGIDCACSANNDLIVWPFTLYQSHPLIRMHGCRTVDLQTLSMSTYPPRELEIVLVHRLQLQHSVFHNLKSSVDRLLFADTVIPSIGSYVFHQIAHLKRLEFRNVTVGSIDTAAFGMLDDIGTILICNSRIGSIAEKAFVNISRVGSIRIVDTRIDRIAPDAIVVRHVHTFAMLNVSVGDWSNHSLTLVNVSRVTVDGCEIEVMADSALTTMLTDQLVFDGNHISWLRSNAFDGLCDASNISLVGNRIERMDADAMLPLLSKDITLNMINNSLPCGEDFCSLVEDGDLRSFESILDGNWCLNGSRTLAEFTSMMDDEDVCRLGHSSGAENTSLNSSMISNSGQILIPSSQLKSAPAFWLSSVSLLIAVASWSALIAQ